MRQYVYLDETFSVDINRMHCKKNRTRHPPVITGTIIQAPYRFIKVILYNDCKDRVPVDEIDSFHRAACCINWSLVAAIIWKYIFHALLQNIQWVAPINLNTPPKISVIIWLGIFPQYHLQFDDITSWILYHPALHYLNIISTTIYSYMNQHSYRVPGCIYHRN